MAVEAPELTRRMKLALNKLGCTLMQAVPKISDFVTHVQGCVVFFARACRWNLSAPRPQVVQVHSARTALLKLLALRTHQNHTTTCAPKFLPPQSTLLIFSSDHLRRLRSRFSEDI